ncbi:MAG: DEAD/DEAH box helicase, partial [Sulfurovum sp.]|nr:DEAD/DEAH box helicase [Sulfurovaceae bacterium]
NVELKYSEDIENALNEFEDLWSKSIEIKEEDIDTIKQNSYLKPLTPYEVYLKFLIEHFENRVDYDASVANDLPKGYMKLAYQVDAVNEGIAKIKKHNGFFLSDVVGLGKTITSAMIVRRLCLDAIIKGQILIIAPPSIKKEWIETFDKFKIANYKQFEFKSYGALEKIKDTQKYEVIIIDESHKFKNFATSRYKELERICKTPYENRKKKIILVSATPLNNKPQDLANQLYLFQDKRNSTIDSHPNLETFFADIDKTYKEIIGKKEDKHELTKNELEELEKLSKRVRDNILREVMVRRTRTDLKTNRYKKDLEAQGLKIPKINPIAEVNYKLDDNLLEVFDKTIDLLTNEKTGLQYHRYKILAYLNEDGKKKYGKIQEGFIELSSEALAKLMQTMLIKRLESSFTAFKSTINKQKRNLLILIGMFKEGVIFIPTKHFNLYDLIEQDEDNFTDKIEDYLANEKMKAFDSSDFNDIYMEQLESDLVILEDIVKLWEDIDYDPKLDKFKMILDEHSDEKIVVFTESKQTALYLEEQLKDYKKVLTVHGGNRDKLKDTIRENFDANYTKEQKKNDFNVIISTDTLSEGVNMHQSNIIYNYDIPWNSTRLMQRIGRINRIGTSHDQIHIYNFKPTAQSEALIELSKKAFIKLQTFHHTVGEDSQIYSKDEKVGSVSLYEEDTEKPDAELKFLEEIRSYHEANPQKFKLLKKLPKKVRVQRDLADLSETSFVFIKNYESKNYYKVDDENCEAVSFVNMANYLKTDKNEKGILPVKEYHYKHVQKAIDFYEKELSGISTQAIAPKVKNKSDIYAINRVLKPLRDNSRITQEQHDIFKQTITEGKLQNLSKEIITAYKKYQGADITMQMNNIEEKYSLASKDTEEKQIKKVKIDIVLSETFV